MSEDDSVQAAIVASCNEKDQQEKLQKQGKCASEAITFQESDDEEPAPPAAPAAPAAPGVAADPPGWKKLTRKLAKLGVCFSAAQMKAALDATRPRGDADAALATLQTQAAAVPTLPAVAATPPPTAPPPAAAKRQREEEEASSAPQANEQLSQHELHEQARQARLARFGAAA